MSSSTNGVKRKLPAATEAAKKKRVDFLSTGGGNGDGGASAAAASASPRRPLSLGGDELDDNLAVDDEYLEATDWNGDDDDGEGEGEGEGGFVAGDADDDDGDDNDDGGDHDDGRRSKGPKGKVTSSSKKSGAASVEDDEESAERKKARREKDKARLKMKKELKAEAASTKGRSRFDIATKHPELQKAAMDELIMLEGKGKLTQLELHDKALAKEHFADVGHFSLQHSIENLEPFIKHLYPNWKKKLSGDSKKETGTPIILIVSPAATRAVDLIRYLPDMNKLCRIAKLFARHLKVEEQVDYLSKHVCRIGVGTPNRLVKLAEDNALKLDKIELLLVDMMYDEKSRNILDIAETRSDFLKLVDTCRPRIVAGQTKLAFY